MNKDINVQYSYNATNLHNDLVLQHFVNITNAQHAKLELLVKIFVREIRSWRGKCTKKSETRKYFNVTEKPQRLFPAPNVHDNRSTKLQILHAWNMSASPNDYPIRTGSEKAFMISSLISRSNRRMVVRMSTDLQRSLSPPTAAHPSSEDRRRNLFSFWKKTVSVNS